MSRRTAILVGAAALAVVAIALARDGAPSEQVEALKADPIASYVPPGGTLVDTDSQNEGTSLGKPVQAEYSRLFELGAGGAERPLEHARAAAIADGWTPVGRVFEVAGSSSFQATKRLPTGRAELTATFYAGARLLPRDVKPPALGVSLRRLGR